MQFEDFLALVAPDGVLHLAGRDRHKIVDEIAAEPFNPELHYPIIFIYIHYALLEHSGKLLAAVPDKEDETYKQLEDYHKALEDCHNNNVAVFPLSVRYRDWWNGSHLDLPNDYSYWHPFRVNYLNHEQKGVFCTVAKLENGKPIYGEIILPFGVFPELPTEGAMGEMAYYEEGRRIDGQAYIFRYHEKTWNYLPELKAIVDQVLPIILKSNQLISERWI